MRYQIRVVPARGMVWFAQANDANCPHEAEALFALLVRIQPHCNITLLRQKGTEPAVPLQIHD